MRGYAERKYRCAKLAASYPRRLKAVIAVKGASTKLCVMGVNNFVEKVSGSEYFPNAL